MSWKKKGKESIWTAKCGIKIESLNETQLPGTLNKIWNILWFLKSILPVFVYFCQWIYICEFLAFKKADML